MSDPDDRPVLPESTRDDTDEGWTSYDDVVADDDARLHAERPPHHEERDRD